MKLLLLKTLLQRRNRDEGYAIPVVFALGLIMTLIGTISIFQSSDEEIISISQRETSKALAAAEVGVTRLREQINKYKVIAMHDACSSSDWGGDEVCDNADTVPSWKTASKINGGVANIRNLDTYCPESGSTTADNDDNVEALATRAWQNIGSDASQGQYRLIDYEYSSGGAIDSVTGGFVAGGQPTGKLTVEGRVNQDNTDLDNEPGAALARLEVELPIQPGIPNPDSVTSIQPDLNNFDPALWLVGASDATNIDLGDIQVDGNIVVEDGDCNHSGTLPATDDLANSTNNSVIVDPRNDVSIVPDPSTYFASSPLSPHPLGITASSKVRNITLSDLKTLSLPLARQVPAVKESETIGTDEVYFYKLVDSYVSANGTSLILGSDDDITIRNDRKVVLFVEGNIDITAGSQPINVNSGLDSEYLEIYMTNDASTIEFRGNGDVNINAFLHAPESPVNVAGDPNVTFTGAMWVEDFNGSSLINDFTINSDDRYYNYTYIFKYLDDRDLKIADPIIDVPSEWKTQEVN